MGDMDEIIGHKIEENMQRIVNLIQNLRENLPKGEDIDQGTQEDKYSVHVGQLSINKNYPRGFDSNNGNN